MTTNKFNIGDKVKCLHESLGRDKFYVIGVISATHCKMNKWVYSIVIDDLYENELEHLDEKE